MYTLDTRVSVESTLLYISLILLKSILTLSSFLIFLKFLNLLKFVYLLNPSMSSFLLSLICNFIVEQVIVTLYKDLCFGSVFVSKFFPSLSLYFHMLEDHYLLYPTIVACILIYLSQINLFLMRLFFLQLFMLRDTNFVVGCHDEICEFLQNYF